jgi:hypothetical protein
MTKKRKIGKLKNTVADWKKALLGSKAEDAPLTPLDRQMVREGLPHHHSTIDHPIAGKRCPGTPDGRHRFQVVGDNYRCAACPGWKE